MYAMGLSTLLLLSQAGSDPVAEAVPELGQVALGGLVVIGLVLVFFGRKLAKAGFITSGLVFGGAAGLLIGGTTMTQPMYVLITTAAAAAIGAVLAAVVYKFWIALSTGLAVALATVAVLLVFSEQPLPDAEIAVPQTATSDLDALTDFVDDASGLVQDEDRNAMDLLREVWELSPGQDQEQDNSETLPARDDTRTTPEWEVTHGSESGEAARELAVGTTQRIVNVLQALYKDQTDQLTQWWEDRGDAGRQTIMIAALAGAAVGVVIGLLMSNLAAAFQSALAGSILVVMPGRYLLTQWLPELADQLPSTPRWVLIAMGLITAAGVVVQNRDWKKKPKRVDKHEEPDAEA